MLAVYNKSYSRYPQRHHDQRRWRVHRRRRSHKSIWCHAERVHDCTISGGVAEIGGGLYNAGQATLTDCTISGNDATGSSGGGQGGGISNGLLQNKAVLILTDSTVEGNTAKLGGGGLFNNGTATVTDSTFVNNFANQAGSLLASDGGAVNNSGTVTLVACTISGNTTTKAGGGIYNGGLGLNVATLNDTIIAGNTNTSGGASDIANSGGDFTCSYDLLGLGVGGTINGGTGDIVLTSLNDLELAPLANYGGPTETMALSPAVPRSPAAARRFKSWRPTADHRPARSPARHAHPRYGRLSEPGIHADGGRRQHSAVHIGRSESAQPLSPQSLPITPSSPSAAAS